MLVLVLAPRGDAVTGKQTMQTRFGFKEWTASTSEGATKKYNYIQGGGELSTIVRIVNVRREGIKGEVFQTDRSFLTRIT